MFVGTRNILALLAFCSVTVSACASLDDAAAPGRSATQTAVACSASALRSLPDVRITLVTEVTVPVPHCKVHGVIGTETRFELLLPSDWNGKFVMGGGGGFVGSVQNTSLMFGALQAGFASAGTDSGHPGHPLDASWAHNNLERLVSFGYQAVHRTAVTAKALIESYYGSGASLSYFTGCSRGGGQALMEAQRYPEDFDGIVAGAPAMNWSPGLAALTTQVSKAMYPDLHDLETAIVGPEEQALIESSYLAICDAEDGIEDGILNDPRRCKFDVATLRCESGRSDGCLTEEQLAAVRLVYDGPRDSRGNPLYYGYPFGGETAPGGWSRWLTGGLKYQADLAEFQGAVQTGGFPAPVVPSAHFGFGMGIMKYFLYNDPDWTYENYDWDSLVEDSARVAETLNATDPDLSEFRKHGGKLIIYSGWSDNAIPGPAVTGYYDNVLAHDETAVDDVRLFMMPGVEHCFGGPGPWWVNFLTEIDSWVESGTAPDQVTAYWLDQNRQPAGSRPVCAYPGVAKYDGKGDTQDASSFRCVASE